MDKRKTLIKFFSIRLLYAICATMVLPGQLLAAELVTGMNVNIQVWSDQQRDALLEQLTTGNVKVIRCGFHAPRAFYLDFAKRLYEKGIKIDLLIGCGYPENTKSRPESKQYGMRSAETLSLADPDISKKNFQSLFDDLDEQGIVLGGLELGNEINWADFNGDFPVPGQGRIFGFSDLSKDPEAKTVARGFLQYLKCLAALKEVRDHSRLNKNTPIVLGGLVYFNGWPPPKLKLDGVNLDATLQFMKAHGLDKLVDIYAFHCYPQEGTAEARKNDVDTVCAYSCPPNSNAGKPCWITEWGVSSNPDEKEETKLVKEVMHDFHEWAKKDRLLEVIYFSWNYYKANQTNPVFRDGKLQPIGKAALTPR
jgi:Glycosyl hydrolase catalytic core